MTTGPGRAGPDGHPPPEPPRRRRPSGGSRARRRLQAILVDISPLRESREFRLLYIGQVVSFFGRQLTVVATSLQIFLLTGSSLQVGLLSLAQLPPLVVCSLYGGALADAQDRRRLLVFANVGLALTSVGLALNAMTPSPAVWPLYACTMVSAGLSGVDYPTRSASVPTLVRRDQIPAAAALNQVMYQLGAIVGPAAAGVLIGQVGLAAAYWADVVTFAVALATLAMMAPLVPEGAGGPAGLSAIREGLSYLRGQKAVQGTFVIDVDAMVFGMPRALFPELGTRLYGGGADTVGRLYAAPGAGALIGALTTGWVTKVRYPGRAVLWAVAAWGLAIAAFGLVTVLPLGLVLLALAGAADVVSAVFRGTILQLTVPDRLRGRLNALHIAVVTGGPRLGDAESGAVAAVAGAQVSVVSGGLACLVGVAVIAKALPELERWAPPYDDANGTLGPTST
ncbi:MAG: MFS transporter [Acidimicrobiia bacterium]